MKSLSTYDECRKKLSQPLEDQLIQESNSKIANYLRTISKLESTIKTMNNQINYYRNTSLWVKAVLQQKDKRKNNSNGLKSLMDASSKLTLLQKQSILSKKAQPKFANNQQQSNPNQKCSSSSHIEFILSQKNQNKQKINDLVKVRDNLYKQIQQQLQKQQPFLHQKIMKKIKKEVRRQVKMEAVKQMEKICKAKKKWIQDKKQQIDLGINEKIIEQKVMANLSRMKQLMQQKISNDQFINQVANNESKINKKIELAKKQVAQVKNIIKMEMQKMQNETLQYELEEIENQKKQRLAHVEFDDVLIEQISKTMSEAKSLLTQPLQEDNCIDLVQRCEAITKQLGQLAKRKY